MTVLATKAATVSKFEFIGLMAGLMAVDVLAVDIMLPAFPTIGHAFGVVNPNDRSLVLTYFLLGFGPPQLLFGPLADRFGRRSVILAGLGAYIATSFAAAAAPSFAALLVLRFLQGVAAAAVRVAMSAAVRDRYSGKAMVDIMSMVLVIFLLVPIVSPSIGQGLLLVGSWRLIFVFIGAVALAFAVWTWLRLPESLSAANRRRLDFAVVADGFRIVLSNRRAFFYGIVGAFMYGIICGLLNTSQQIYVDIYGLGKLFPVAFAFNTAVAAVSQFFVARVTTRLGMRRTAHAAVTVIVLASAGFGLISLFAPLPLWMLFLMLFLCFPAIVATFTTTSAMAMEPLGEVAGTASSVFGTTTPMGGVVFGYLIAQLYDGTLAPVLFGNAVLGLCALACFVVAERGRLFAGDQAPRDSSALGPMRRSDRASLVRSASVI